MNYYIKAFKHYFDFSGRAIRKEFWVFFLVHIIVAFGLSVFDSGIFQESQRNVLTGLYALGSVFPMYAVMVRRLHDTGRSGWWIFIPIIPIIGAIILIVFLSQRSKNTPEQVSNNQPTNTPVAT